MPDLTGAWRIKRRIWGHDARFTGTATITPDGRYTETGVLHQNGLRTEAFRHYVYKTDGDTLRISHGDGRHFLDLMFKDGMAAGTHLCGQDFYKAFFRFKADGRWLMAYDVQGPKKRMFIVSVLTRI